MPGPSGVSVPENYGNKFPGEAAVYMGIVHAAIYDAAVAIEGGYEPYAITLTPRPTRHPRPPSRPRSYTLIGLQPALGLTPDQQAILDGDYANYLAAIPDGAAKTNGIVVGEQVAAAVRAARERRPGKKPHACRPKPAAAGPWHLGAKSRESPASGPGTSLAGNPPLALNSASQFVPTAPIR